MVHLGPFLVHQRLGRGGMGEVWAGHHVAQDIPVAIKVLGGTERRTENFVAAFRMEVRAAAALEHPSIVAVLDQGLVGAEAEAASGGHFVAGMPYLVMERAGSDTLSSWAGRMPWEQLRASLLAILSALAHAHARGVLHRDIKPGNVLCDPAGGDLRVSDFGLARIIERDHAFVAGRSGAPSETLTGTPAYMAPEQFDAEGRDIGPWSDLYAVGCLAWTLVTGAPPFGRPAPAAAMAAHLHRALPPLTPRTRVPEALEAWMRHLLEKDPADRPGFAADAADALRRVEGPFRAAMPPPVAPPRFGALPADAESARTDPAAGPPPPSFGAVPTGHLTPVGGPGEDQRAEAGDAAGRTAEQTDTLPVDVAARARATATGSDPEVTVPLGGGAGEPHDPSVSRRSLSFGVLPVLQRGNRARGPHPTPMPRATLPAHWEAVVPPTRPRPVFLDAGLGLFGVRATALVGREAERDALWEALRHVQGRASIVVLRGPVGSGKTRLAEWAGEVAHASGAAQVLRVIHAREPSPRDGLGPALLRALHGEGLDHEALAARIEARLVGGEGGLDPEEAPALAALLLPGPPAGVRGPAGHAPGSTAETQGPSTTPRERQAALVRLLARLCRERPLVALVENAQWGRDVVALARDLLRTAPTVPVLFLFVTGADDDLGPDLTAGTPGVRVVEVPPLDAAAHAGLVRELLGLAPGLAAQVASRTAGHPLFAVQLVGDWVARGLLRPGPEGFELREGATPDLPDDLHALWARQVDEVVAGQPAWELALEAAAVLGAEVETRHLAAVVQRLDRGSAGGVPVLTPPSGAGALRGPTAPPQESHDGTRGLVEALFRARLAVPPLADGLGDWRFAHAMLRESLLRRVVEGGRSQPLHAACAEVLAGVAGTEERRAWHLVHAGRPAEAAPLFEVVAGRRADAGETAAALALVAAWEGALHATNLVVEDVAWAAPALRRAEIAVAEGGLGEAQAQFSAIAARAHACGWTRVEAVALLREAVVWRDRGVPARAEACVAQARTLVGEDDPALRAQYLYVMGRALRMRGDGVGAERALLEAVAIYDTLGNARDAALCCDSLGGIAVQALRLDDAWRWAEAALARATAAGMRAGIAEARVMFGEVERLRGNLAAAEGHYRDALALARVASPTTVTFAWANLGLVLLLLGRWSEAEPYIRDALRDFEAQGRTFFVGAMQVGLLGCAAARGDFAAWDAHLAAAEACLHATGFHDVDVALCAELAAREAGARGETQRARGAWRIARDQRRALGHGAEAEAAEREMGVGG